MVWGSRAHRPPCPLPTTGVYSNSCPLSQWCHPTISSSVIPFSCLQSFPASGSFQMNQLFASGGQSIGVSASASVLPMNIQDWFQTLDTWNWRRHMLCLQCHCQGADNPSWCFCHISYGSNFRVWTWTKTDGAVWGKKIFKWGKGRVHCLGLQLHALISPVTFFPLHSNPLEAEISL